MEWASGFGWMDWAAFAILAGSMLLGVMRGVVREIFSLVAWVFAFWLAKTYAEAGAIWLAPYIGSEALRLVAGFALFFAGGWAVMALLGVGFNALVNSTGLGALNRVLGGLFGLARGALIIVVLTLLAGMTSLTAHREWRAAWFSDWSETCAHWLLPYLPPGMAERIQF
ncbi:MAG: CvpA family protein [Betaproteobacteria bacterium]|nr:CvpA family protein [Betaproteobacteria bacterium]MDE2623169.1 CvpA family protein [Betaproteobacteria bacterium]